MKTKVLGYWVTTIIVVLELLAGGVTDLVHGREVLFVGEPVANILAQLGYPVYLLTILGVWKLLGAITLLAPHIPRLKEWAYAGIFFEMTGAAVSNAVRGSDPAPSSFSWLSPFSFSLRGRFDRQVVSLESSFPPEARVVHRLRTNKPRYVRKPVSLAQTIPNINFSSRLSANVGSSSGIIQVKSHPARQKTT